MPVTVPPLPRVPRSVPPNSQQSGQSGRSFDAASAARMRSLSQAPGGAATRSAPSAPAPVDPNRLDHSKLSSHWQGITKPLQTIAQDTFVTGGDFPRADAMLAKAVQEGFAERDGEADWRQQAMDRLAERSRGRYPVPKTIHCDRTCLLHPSDAEYVDKMQAFLFGHDTADPPLLTSPGLWGVRVGHDHVWADETKIEWTIASALGRALSYDDYYVARRQEQHPHRLQLFNFRGTRFTLCQPWEQFPTLPAGVTLRTDLRGISMPRIRALTYFAHVAKRFGGNVAERWFTSFTYELFAHSLVAHKLAWIRPLGYSPRVWVVSDAYVEWVHSVRGIPDIPVISSGGEQIAPVNVANVIAILTAASKSTRSVARRDFATNTVMSFVLCPEGPDRPDDPLPRRARNRSQARGPDEITPVGTPRGAIAVETPPLAGRKRAHNDLGAPSVPAATGRSERGGRRLDLGWLRRQTALPADMLSLLPGNGPWTPAEVINTICLENIRMGTEIRRLRSDVDYWREEVRLLQPEPRGGDRYDRDYDDPRYDDGYDRDYRPREARREPEPAPRPSTPYRNLTNDPYDPYGHNSRAGPSSANQDPYDDPYGTSRRRTRAPQRDPYEGYPRYR